MRTYLSQQPLPPFFFPLFAIPVSPRFPVPEKAPEQESLLGGRINYRQAQATCTAQNQSTYMMASVVPPVWQTNEGRRSTFGMTVVSVSTRAPL